MRVFSCRLILGLLMSLLVSFNLGLRQFVHTFEGHEETAHHCNLKKEFKGAGLFIEAAHHHCDYLSELLPAFITASSLELLPQVVLGHFDQFVIGYKSFFSYNNLQAHLVRGPPQKAILLNLNA
jgi:hypothetical protein